MAFLARWGTALGAGFLLTGGLAFAATITFFQDVRYPASSSTSTFEFPGITVKATTSDITSGNDIRIRIPTASTLRWNSSDTVVQIVGPAAGKVASTTTVSRISTTEVIVDVSSDFNTGEFISIYGLSVTNSATAATATGLQLTVDSDTTNIEDTSEQVFTVAYATFGGGSTIRIPASENPIAVDLPDLTVGVTSTNVITASNDIRIRIPQTTNPYGFQWRTTATVTVSGPGSSKVTTPTYAGQTLTMDVTADFLTTDDIRISGLQFDRSGGWSGGIDPPQIDFLELLLDGGTNVATTCGKPFFMKTLTLERQNTAIPAGTDQDFGLVTIKTGDSTIGTDTWTGDLRLVLGVRTNGEFRQSSGITVMVTPEGNGTIANGVTIEDDETGGDQTGFVARFDVTSAVQQESTITIQGLKFDNNSGSAKNDIDFGVSFTGPAKADGATSTATSFGSGLGFGTGVRGSCFLAESGGSEWPALLTLAAAALLSAAAARLVRRFRRG